MRIAFILPNDWSNLYGGGAEYQSYLLLKKLICKKRFNAFYICRNIDSKYQHGKINLIGINRLAKKEYPLFLDMFTLYKTLKRLNPDIIYQRIGCAYTGICAYYAKKHKKKMIWHVSIDEDVKPFIFKKQKDVLFKFIEKKFVEYGIKNATHIITQTSSQKKMLYDNYY
ncbi:MAG: hypothetical protein ACTSVV_00845, partial [Promethearchaeota archaeon]